jgi:glycosyl transferase family 25
MSDILLDLPVWLISLPRATARRTRMQQRLAALGLNYTIIDGVDGVAEAERLLVNTDIPQFERNMGRKILIGGLGCYHSHLLVWEHFLASKQPVALILEDDVVFHDDFLYALRLSLAAQSHWDFLKLNKIRAKLPICQGMIGPYRLNAYIGPATGTGAYLINRATAAKLLPAMRRVSRATDHEINRFFTHDFRLRGLEGFPSHVEDGPSLIATGDGGYSAVRKFSFYRRLPNYRLRAANYLRRIVWLFRHGELFPNYGDLVNKPVIPKENVVAPISNRPD